MSDPNSFNQKIIEEFRANGGKVGGPFEGGTMLLLTTTGAKSGQARIAPLVCLPDGDRVVIFASKAGAPTNPDWYHNLMVHPEVTVEIGTDKYQATAVEVIGTERDELYARQAKKFPNFADYAANTTRVIPVVVLNRIAA